jgi:hypothetical protein
VLQRIQKGAVDPVAVGLPSLLWALMGISTTSLVGSPLIHGTKQDKDPTEEATNKVARKNVAESTKRAAEKNKKNKKKETGTKQENTQQVTVTNQENIQQVTGTEQENTQQLTVTKQENTQQVTVTKQENTQQVTGAKQENTQQVPATQAEIDTATQKINDDREGILCINQDPKDASFNDIFTGEEINNCDRLDLSKIQMFYFTIIAVVTYAVALYGLMHTNALNPGDLKNFPPLPDGLVALLTISHSGYLINKAVDHTQTQ